MSTVVAELQFIFICKKQTAFNTRINIFVQIYLGG